MEIMMRIAVDEGWFFKSFFTQALPGEGARVVVYPYDPEAPDDGPTSYVDSVIWAADGTIHIRLRALRTEAWGGNVVLVNEDPRPAMEQWGWIRETKPEIRYYAMHDHGDGQGHAHSTDQQHQGSVANPRANDHTGVQIMSAQEFYAWRRAQTSP